MRELSNNTYIYIFVALTSLMVIIVLITAKFVRKVSRQTEKLELSEQYYKSLFEQNPDIIITFD